MKTITYYQLIRRRGWAKRPFLDGNELNSTFIIKDIEYAESLESNGIDIR
jgi:hypothetical protein